MKNINVSILGTGMIVPVFLENAERTGGYHIRGIWGRDARKAAVYDSKADYTTDDLDRVLQDPETDVIYIALPNSMHASYAVKALQAGRNVMVEKPFAASYAEALEVIQLAEKQGLLVFDMCMTPYHANYRMIPDYLKELGQVRVVTGILSHYSRRYDRFLAGEVLPVFDPKFAGGTLMDLGIYLIRYVYGLFGMPEHVHYHANIVRDIDTSGILVLDYPQMKASLTATKDASGPSFVLIQCEHGRIMMEGPAGVCHTITVEKDGADRIVLPGPDTHTAMSSELTVFKEMYAETDPVRRAAYLSDILSVQKILDLAREDAGIQFI